MGEGTGDRSLHEALRIIKKGSNLSWWCPVRQLDRAFSDKKYSAELIQHGIFLFLCLKYLEKLYPWTWRFDNCWLFLNDPKDDKTRSCLDLVLSTLSVAYTEISMVFRDPYTTRGDVVGLVIRGNISWIINTWIWKYVPWISYFVVLNEEKLNQSAHNGKIFTLSLA